MLGQMRLLGLLLLSKKCNPSCSSKGETKPPDLYLGYMQVAKISSIIEGRVPWEAKSHILASRPGYEEKTARVIVCCFVSFSFFFFSFFCFFIFFYCNISIPTILIV